jgi:hypothetical protein
MRNPVQQLQQQLKQAIGLSNQALQRVETLLSSDGLLAAERQNLQLVQHDLNIIRNGAQRVAQRLQRIARQTADRVSPQNPGLRRLTIQVQRLSALLLERVRQIKEIEHG